MMETQSNQSGSSFGGYQKIIIQLVSDLKRLQELSTRLEVMDLAGLINQARLSLESKNFSVAVVGEFKRGKSTFINALLGKEILPSDILPTTATINRVTYGLKPSVKIIFKGDNGEDGDVEHIGIDQLDDYVTKKTAEAEEIAATIKEAVVQYPVSYCQNNVDIIDTPGLSDDETMTNVTMGVLPKVDAAIMVVMATAPFSEAESSFLDELLIEQGLGSVIFVVTALDRIRRVEEQERVLQEITNRIKDSIVAQGEAEYGPDTEAYHHYLKRVGEPRIFGISGYLALEGKVKHDEELLLESRFPEFEKILERFLTEESGAIALKTHAERIISFCKEILKKLELQIEVLQKQPEKFQKDYTIISALLTTLERMGQEEIRQIDRAISRARERTRPALNQVASRYKELAGGTVDTININAADLEVSNSMALKTQMAEQVNANMQEVYTELARTIQQELQAELASEVNRLLAFAVTVDRTIRHVKMEFARFEAGTLGTQDIDRKNFSTDSMVTRLGGQLGFDQSTTASKSMEVIFGNLSDHGIQTLTTFLSLPSDWVASLNVDVGSTSGGGFMQKVTTSFNRIGAFKSSYKKALLETIDQQMLQQQSHIDQQVNEHTVNTFDILKREIETALQQARSLQIELEGKRERVRTLNEREHTELIQMQKEVQHIQNNAQQLSNQLIDLTSR